MSSAARHSCGSLRCKEAGHHKKASDAQRAIFICVILVFTDGSIWATAVI